MFARLQLTEEEKKHRRQMTNFAVKLMLLTTGAALIVQLVYYFAVLPRSLTVESCEFPPQVSVTVSALGLLTLLLAVNHLKTVPHWVATILFLLALVLLALFSDHPHEVIHGRSTMFFMVPILLSGVLIHSYATFLFTGLVISLLAIYVMFQPSAASNAQEFREVSAFRFLFKDLPIIQELFFGEKLSQWWMDAGIAGTCVPINLLLFSPPVVMLTNNSVWLVA